MTRPGYVDVDSYQKKTSLKEAAKDCGAQVEVSGSGRNVRIDCAFNCAGDHAGKREIVVDTENPAKQFDCKAYACQTKGNLLCLMYGWLNGKLWSGSKLRGSEFNEVKERIQKKIAGTLEERPTTPPPSKKSEALAKETAAPSSPAPIKNIPLAESDHPGARGLIGMEEKFVTDPGAMTPAAGSYFRLREHFLTKELCEEWGVGVIPSDGGGDKRGFSLRKNVVYRFLSEANQPIAFVGRDPEFERKLEEYEAVKPERRDASKKPEKFKFPKGFCRGLEFYGQHTDRLKRHPEYREFLARYGVIIVEGCNDVLRLDHAGVPAIAATSNEMTKAQREKAIRFAKTVGGGKINLWYDADDSGEAGLKEDLWMLKQMAPDIDIRIASSRLMYGGKFANLQPEHFTKEQIEEAILPGLER